MVKKVSLNIPDDSYKKLASLSDFYKQDVKNAIISILEVVGGKGQWIINLGKEFKVPVKLINVMAILFDAGFTSIYSLFNDVLEKLDAKGLYALEDFQIDLEKDYVWFSYYALKGSDLQISGFYLAIEHGIITLTTHSYIDVKEVDNKTLGKLKKLVQNVEPSTEFGDVEDCSIEIEEDEEFWKLKINCEDESFYYLPSVKKMSKFVERIYKKAGVKFKKVKN